MDCVEYMKLIDNNFFDLAIVDPPYGLSKKSTEGSGKLKGRALNVGHINTWDVKPNEEYFEQLFRVSVNQIIWGGNYFQLPPCRGFIVWDKCQPWENFSACEYAWTSFDCPSKIFKFDNRTGDKIHPTQKPVELYQYLLANFAKDGYRILDTHLGSGSIAIACHELGFDLVGCEIDNTHFENANERLRLFQQQDLMRFGD